MSQTLRPPSTYCPPTEVNPAFEAQLARVLANVPPLLRLPKAGTRCPYTQLSRTGLSELVSPTLRNGGKPPVQAMHQRTRRHAVRGVWLIPAEALFRYLLSLGTQPIEVCSPASAGDVRLNEDHGSDDGHQRAAQFPAQPSRPCDWPAPDLSVHLSFNPHMLFVPKSSFGNRAVGGRLVKTIVPDDESLPPMTFIEIAEDEWASETGQAWWAEN